MVGLRFEARRLCSAAPPLPPLGGSAILIAASRMLIVYAGSPTILCGATGKQLTVFNLVKFLIFRSIWARIQSAEIGGKLCPGPAQQSQSDQGSIKQNGVCSRLNFKAKHRTDIKFALLHLAEQNAKVAGAQVNLMPPPPHLQKSLILLCVQQYTKS